MRRRLGSFRSRSMARPPDGNERVSLSPRARRLVGWAAAAAIIVAVAVFVGVLGGNADGTAVVPTPTPTASEDASEIRFGTALDPTTQEVAAGALTDRFVESDQFAYSYRPPEPPPGTVFVEVRREADGSGAPVQEPAPHGLAEDALVIAFEVPAANLFADFGSGPFQMRIYLEADAPPAAIGSFELVEPSPTESP